MLVNKVRKSYHIGMAVAKRARKDDLAALGELAERQEGYFSAAQAALAGVDRHRLQRLTGQGIIERDKRGIYRFPNYPLADRGELWRAVLWPTVRRGDVLATLSHGTALSLYDVSTINPSVIDISLPRSVRIRRVIPPAYRLHFRNYSSGEVTTLHSLPATTLFRTLLDLILDSSESQFVSESLENAPRMGLLNSAEVNRLRTLRDVDPELLAQVTRDRTGN
jgi:predicted transcriptional regulator of viral defense system